MNALDKTESLNQIIKSVTNVFKVEQIYLLGSTLSTYSTESIFSNPIESTKVIDFRFFIVTSKDEKREDDDVLRLIQNCCNRIAPSIVITIPFKIFCMWLKKGHLLAHTVCQCKCLVYDSGSFNLNQLGNYNIVEVKQKIKKEFVDWSNRAVEFYNGVESFKSRGQFSLALFLLHQATELSLMAAVRLAIGFRAGTHDLERLQNYCIAFCGRQFNFLPRNNHIERRIFEILRKSYVYSRYKDDFIVTEKDFVTIENRVKLLITSIRKYAVDYHNIEIKELTIE